MSSGKPLRHNDYLDHMLEAIGLIRSYVDGFSKDDFWPTGEPSRRLF
jgi:uncharacterized protein with HEPN domain